MHGSYSQTPRTRLEDLLDIVGGEVLRAHAKFGDQFGLTDPEWQSVLLEEVGEAASLVTKSSVPPVSDPYLATHKDELRGELIQVAAVAIRWIAAIEQAEAAP
jgi:hypothetical protein